MNINTKILSALALSALVIAITAVIIVMNTSKVQAGSDREQRGFVVNWGITSLAPGQTARLNVVNIGNPDTRVARVTLAFDVYELGGPDTCPGATEAACTNNLRFVRRESSEATLLPGEGKTSSYTAGDRETRVIAIMLGGPDTRDDTQTRLASTLEIREAARTLFVSPVAIKGFNPQPDPPQN